MQVTSPYSWTALGSAFALLVAVASSHGALASDVASMKPATDALIPTASRRVYRPLGAPNVLAPAKLAADRPHIHAEHTTCGETKTDEARESDSETAKAQTRAGIELLRNGNYFSAARLFQNAADEGDPRAQTNLGWMYALGQGVRRDDQRAIILFIKASLKRFPNAQDSLGWMYQHGRGVAQDNPLAMGWYKRAADQGFEKGKRNFAAMQRRGWSPRFEGP